MQDWKTVYCPVNCALTENMLPLAGLTIASFCERGRRPRCGQLAQVIH